MGVHDVGLRRFDDSLDALGGIVDDRPLVEEWQCAPAAGRQRAVAEFALPRIIDAYEELYREALASRV